jgi:hypothetical protein
MQQKAVGVPILVRVAPAGACSELQWQTAIVAAMTLEPCEAVDARCSLVHDRDLNVVVGQRAAEAQSERLA